MSSQTKPSVPTGITVEQQHFPLFHLLPSPNFPYPKRKKNIPFYYHSIGWKKSWKVLCREIFPRDFHFWYLLSCSMRCRRLPWQTFRSQPKDINWQRKAFSSRQKNMAQVLRESKGGPFWPFPTLKGKQLRKMRVSGGLTSPVCSIYKMTLVSVGGRACGKTRSFTPFLYFSSECWQRKKFSSVVVVAMRFFREVSVSQICLVL